MTSRSKGLVGGHDYAGTWLGACTEPRETPVMAMSSGFIVAPGYDCIAYSGFKRTLGYSHENLFTGVLILPERTITFWPVW